MPNALSHGNLIHRAFFTSSRHYFNTFLDYFAMNDEKKVYLSTMRIRQAKER